MMMGDRSLEETKAEPVSKGPIALPVGPLALAQAQAANGTSMVPPAELDMSPLVIGSVPPADTQDNSK